MKSYRATCKCKEQKGAPAAVLKAAARCQQHRMHGHALEQRPSRQHTLSLRSHRVLELVRLRGVQVGEHCHAHPLQHDRHRQPHLQEKRKE